MHRPYKYRDFIQTLLQTTACSFHCYVCLIKSITRNSVNLSHFPLTVTLTRHNLTGQTTAVSCEMQIGRLITTYIKWHGSCQNDNSMRAMQFCFWRLDALFNLANLSLYYYHQQESRELDIIQSNKNSLIAGKNKYHNASHEMQLHTPLAHKYHYIHT